MQLSQRVLDGRFEPIHATGTNSSTLPIAISLKPADLLAITSTGEPTFVIVQAIKLLENAHNGSDIMFSVLDIGAVQLVNSEPGDSQLSTTVVHECAILTV